MTAPAGLGKTALATHAARLLAGDFLDGQFFVDLQGIAPEPLDPAEGLARLLKALGIAERRIPAGEAQRSEIYRGTLRGRRCLIVLDNAANELQVRPLLPAGSASMVVITSRRPLAGLEDVHRLPLARCPERSRPSWSPRLSGRSGRPPKATRSSGLASCAGTCRSPCGSPATGC